MKADTIKLTGTYFIAALVIAGGFYSLVLVKFQLGDLVNGAIISWVTLVLNSVFSDQVATRSARQSQAAFDKGLASPTPPPTTP